MKKEISPAVIVGAIIGVVAVIGFFILFMVRSDPAAQAPNPPPRFDPAAREAAESRGRVSESVPGLPPGMHSNPPPAKQ